MRELYIYYRVEPAQRERAMQQVEALRVELAAARPELRMRVLRRDGERPGQAETWMEIYTVDAQARGEGVDREIEQDIERRAARLLTAANPPRHCEAFTAADD